MTTNDTLRAETPEPAQEKLSRYLGLGKLSDCCNATYHLSISNRKGRRIFCNECGEQCGDYNNFAPLPTATPETMATNDTLRECVFCEKVKEGSVTFSENGLACYFEPLNPVVAGHLLVIPTHHAENVSDEYGAEEAIKLVAKLTKQIPNCNVITSKGRSATQSVFHLHFHIVPRMENDGLMLPWTGLSLLTQARQDERAKVLVEICASEDYDGCINRLLVSLKEKKV